VRCRPRTESADERSSPTGLRHGPLAGPWYNRSTRMRGVICIALATTSGILTACSGDSRCNVQNLQLAFACHVEPAGTPEGICFDSAAFTPYLRSDAGQAAIWQDVVDACDAANGGAAIQCISQNFPGDTCPILQQELILDGGGPNALGMAVLARCEGLDVNVGSGTCGAQCNACLTQCNLAKFDCEEGCLDAGAAEVCLSCDFSCSQQQIHCFNGCPSS
jgi:hypothetical protein